MYKECELHIIKLMTPMHMGTAEANSIVDLPIQRENIFNFPKIEGSAFKGVINEANELDKLYKNDNLDFSDGKVLFYPVETLSGVKYITSLFVLKRFCEEYKAYKSMKNEDLDLQEFEYVIEDGKCILIGEDGKGYLYINNIFFKMENEQVEKSIKESVIKNLSFIKSDFLKSIFNKLIILSDKNFSEMLTYSSEIVMRNKIDKKNKNTNLFSEEYIPSDTIMYMWLLKKSNFYKKNQDIELNDCFQIGANSSLGKGNVKMIH